MASLVGALVSGSSGPGSSPDREGCVVFLGKTLGSLSKSLTAGVTTAAVTEKVWGEYVSVVCQI